MGTRTTFLLVVTWLLAIIPGKKTAEPLLLPPRTKQIKLFVGAIFSSDGQYVYFVQADLNVRVRQAAFTPRGSNFSACRYTTRREVLTIRRISIASRTEEIIATLPDSPWNGSTMWIGCGMWGYRHANLAFSEAGGLRYDVSGPNWFLGGGEWKVDYDRNHRFDSAVGSWTISKSRPEVMPRSRYSFGTQQIVYSSNASLGTRYILLVDHQQRTVQTLLAVDRGSKKYADAFAYQAAIGVADY